MSKSAKEPPVAVPAGRDRAADVIRDIQKDDELPPEVKEAFTQIVRRLEKKRHINLVGYLVALLVLILGILGGLYFIGSGPPGSSRVWIFMLPLGLVGAVLWLFGRWARKA